MDAQNESIIRHTEDNWMSDFENYYGDHESDLDISDDQQELSFLHKSNCNSSLKLKNPKTRQATPWKERDMTPLYRIVHLSGNGGSSS